MALNFEEFFQVFYFSQHESNCGRRQTYQAMCLALLMYDITFTDMFFFVLFLWHTGQNGQALFSQLVFLVFAEKTILNTGDAHSCFSLPIC